MVYSIHVILLSFYITTCSIHVHVHVDVVVKVCVHVVIISC